ncbi:MAG: hypothetical protein V1826_00805 [bacterium]
MPKVGQDKFKNPVLLVQSEEDKREVDSSLKCYIIASNGNFLKRQTGLIASVVKVKKIPGLMPVPEEATLRAEKLGINHYAVTVMFFRQVMERYDGSEALVTLHYDAARSKWKIDAPLQTVTGASVNADYRRRFPGYQLIGTIHSHNSMSAFHSSTDYDDEVEFDGLHFVIGDLDRVYPSITGVLAVNGARFKVEPIDWFAGLMEVDPKVADRVPVSGFIQQELFPYLDSTQAVRGGCAARNDSDGPRGDTPIPLLAKKHHYSPGKRYDIVLPEGTILRDFVPPTTWLQNVTLETIPVGETYAYYSYDDEFPFSLGLGASPTTALASVPLPKKPSRTQPQRRRTHTQGQFRWSIDPRKE